jgi:hypothetical protein
MSNSETENPGNSKPDSGKLDVVKKKVADIQTCNWQFTWNNYDLKAFEALFIKMRKVSKVFVCQEEKGEKGTPHLQGCIKFKDKKRLTAVVKMMPCHWEKARDWDCLVEYCQKEESRVGKQWFHPEQPEPLELEEPTLPWQLELIDFIETKPDKRTIRWYYDEKGGSGKTEFCRWLKHKMIKVNVSQGGKRNDIIHNCQLAIDKHINMKVFVFDFSRSMETHISYDALEIIKNGMWQDNKYEGGDTLINRPHVIVFANFKPPENVLSADKIKLFELELDDDIKNYIV